MSVTTFEKPWGNYILEKIVETQAPESISWLPQTLGWKILLLIILFSLSIKGYRIYKTYQSNAYRRDALQILRRFKYSADQYDSRQLPVLLRKVALAGFNRAQVTQLNGTTWEIWLDQQCSKTNFNQLCPTLLHQLAYSRAISIDEDQHQLLSEQIALWIQFHRRLDD